MNRRNLTSNSTAPSCTRSTTPNTCTYLPSKPQHDASKENNSRSNCPIPQSTTAKGFTAQLKSKPHKLIAEKPQEFSYYQDILTFVRDLERSQQQSRTLPFSDAGHKRKLNHLYREQSICYLFEMGARHSYKRQTICLALNIYDKYSQVYTASSQPQIREIIVACLFIAGKHVEYIPPPLRKITIQVYSDDIVRREGDILLALNFDLTKYTAFHHLDYLVELFGLPLSERELAHLILDITLFNYKLYSKTRPQLVATGILYVLTQLAEVNFPWSQCNFEKRSVEMIAKQIVKGFNQEYGKHHRLMQKFSPMTKSNPYLAKI